MELEPRAMPFKTARDSARRAAATVFTSLRDRFVSQVSAVQPVRAQSHSSSTAGNQQVSFRAQSTSSSSRTRWYRRPRAIQHSVPPYGAF